MQIYAVKAPGGYLVAAGHTDRDELDKLKDGTVYRLDVKKERNSKFHRKVLSLMRLGYDAWEPPAPDINFNEPLALPPEKDFEAFREEITIAAGYYTVTFDLDGKPVPRAKSISFAKMDEIEFEELFSKIIDVLLQRVLCTYSERELRETVDKVMGYL